MRRVELVRIENETPSTGESVLACTPLCGDVVGISPGRCCDARVRKRFPSANGQTRGH